jgi:hypothetical protein
MDNDRQIVLIEWNDAKFFSGTHTEEPIIERKMALKLYPYIISAGMEAAE